LFVPLFYCICVLNLLAYPALVNSDLIKTMIKLRVKTVDSLRKKCFVELANVALPCRSQYKVLMTIGSLLSFLFQAWSPWSSWSDCSKSCGGGSRKQKRSCVNAGKPCSSCPGAAISEEACNVYLCPCKACNVYLCPCKACNVYLCPCKACNVYLCPWTSKRNLKSMQPM